MHTLKNCRLLSAPLFSEGTKLRLDPPYWRKLRLGEKIPAARGESARARRVDLSLLKGFVFNKSVDYALQGEVDT